MPDSLWFRRLVGVHLVGLLVVATWFRITSLGFAPEPHGDEAYWGLQAMHLLRGLPVAGGSPSGNPINPFFVGPSAALMAVCGPSYQALRVVAAVSGLLTVALAYGLGRRALGERPAVIAAVLMAVLPILIIYARIGWEPCQIPLCGVLGLACAFRRQGLGVVLVVALGLFVHPTTMLAAPIFLAVYLARTAQEEWAGAAGGRWAWRRLWRPLATVLATAAIVGPALLLKHEHPATRWTAQTYGLGPRDWGLYLDRFMKLMLGLCMGGPTEASRATTLLFWALVGVVGLAGSIRLARGRRWDRLALVAALLVMTAALHLKFGAQILHPGLVRYALFLVVPAAWAAASLLDALFPARLDRRSAQLGAGLLIVALLGLADAMLVSVKLHWFDWFNAQNVGRENLWTLRTEVEDPRARVADALMRDLATAPAGTVAALAPIPIVADDWWLHRPLQFYFVDRPYLKPAALEAVLPEIHAPFLAAQLGRGGYVVTTLGHPVDLQARQVAGPEHPLQTRHVHATNGRVYVLHRRRRPDEPPLPACDCPSAQLAAFTTDR